MPRRRMISPEFWTDRKIGYLTRDERGFIVGCISQADDDGRLQADPAFLKAEIYKYDDDLDSAAVKELRDSCLAKMQTWPNNHPYRMAIYLNSDEEYIFFLNWDDIQKPSHPTKSKLPPPPPELLPIFSRAPQETVVQPSRATPAQSSIGQSSQGQVSIGQFSEVQEDFTKVLNESESDLTDFLTTLLTKYIAAGREQAGGLGGGGPGQLTAREEASVRSQWGVMVLEKFWSQAVGKMSTEIFEGSLHALNKYPVEVIAKAFTKAARYKGGTYHKWNYIQKILDEQMEKGSHNKRGPP